MPTLINTTEGAIWSRVIRPEVADITQEAAQAFLRLEFAESDRQRMYELAAKALALLEECKITSLVVVDSQGRVEGIVHLHDLWGVELI